MVRQFKARAVNFKKPPRPTSKTVPEQSLSIGEIVRRFTRGIPVGSIQKRPIYSEQSDFDLEKLGRMDFAEKAALAEELRQRNDDDISALKEAEAKARELANARSVADDKAEKKESEEKGGDNPPSGKAKP